MQQLRFVHNKQNPNLGWTNQELAALQEKMQITFPDPYQIFLLKAGKHANIFLEKFETIDQCIAFQTQCQILLNTNEEAEILQQPIWCIGSEKLHNETFYYFFYLNQAPNPFFVQVCSFAVVV